MIFMIDYPNGHMELYMERFFPCVLKNARKIFPLINQWCDDAQKEKLQEWLSDRAVDYFLDDKETLRRRTLMNIRMLGGAKR